MKPKSKNISKSALLLFIVMLGSSFAKAQTHIKVAANCILHDAYVKEASKTKNAVSCVDCYCKVCGDKKEKAKQAKLKAEETASKQKTATPQKKTTTTTKAKSDEAILVAPKPKVEKNTTAKLSVEDEKIIDIYNNRKDKEKLIVAYCKNDCLVKLQYPEVVTNSGRIFLRQFDNSANNYTFTVLKDNFNLNSKFSYTSYEGELSEEFKDFGLISITFENNQKIFWEDIVDLNGNCVFSNTEYFDVRYDKDSKTFKLEKQGTGLYGAGKFTEEYNPVTKKITPIQ